VKLDKALLDIITIRRQVGVIEREPDAICYIFSGDGIVFDPTQGKFLARLAKGTVFGESNLTRKVSYQSIGEIRSGIRPMKLLKFPNADIKRILTLSEIEMLKDT